MFVRAITKVEIVDELWEEVARDHTATSFSREAFERAAAPAGSSAVKIAPVGAPLPLVALLDLEGAAFVDAAYATLLGRAADEEGAPYVTARLANGYSKIEVLGELQHSKEAREAGHRIAGLRLRYIVRRCYRLPVIGPVALLAASLLRWAGVSRRLGARDEALAALRASVDAQIANLSSDLTRSRQGFDERVAAQQKVIELLSRRLATTQAAQDAAARAASAGQRQVMAHAAQLGREPLAAADGMAGILLGILDEVHRQEERLAKLEGVTELAGTKRQVGEAAASLREEVERRVVALEGPAKQRSLQAIAQQRQMQ